MFFVLAHGYGSSTLGIARPRTVKEETTKVMMTLRDDMSRAWA